MKPEIKQKWIDALRSGKYEQTTQCLYDGDGFCCLGVLCDLVKADLGIDWVRKYTDTEQKSPYVFGDSHQILPQKVVDYTGLPDTNPNLPNDDAPSLAYLNDHGKNFTEIADIIKQYF